MRTHARPLALPPLGKSSEVTLEIGVGGLPGAPPKQLAPVVQAPPVKAEKPAKPKRAPAVEKGEVPIVRGPAVAQHEEEAPAPADEADDSNDSADSDDAPEPAAPVSAGAENGRGAMGLPDGVIGAWGAAAGALAGVNRLVVPDASLEQRNRDASALATIQARLAAQRDRCYPRAAARLRLAGTAKVKFCIGGDGAPTGVQIAQSSGEALLDRAATDCVVKGAAPLPQVSRCILVPVDFTAP